MKTRRFGFSALCLLLTPLFARAEILTYVTQGRVTQITDPLGLLDFVQLEDTVIYRSTFDTSRAGSDPFPGYSTYAGMSSFVQVGTFGFPGNPPTLAVAHPRDLVDMESHVNVAISGLQPTAFVQMVLYDQTESDALTNTALPTEPYDLTLFASAYHQVAFRAPPAQPEGYPIDLWVGATVDSFIIIPEPGSLSLLAAGSLLLIRKHSR